jgi:MarR family transcriptional regulator for hemolysin
VTEATLAKLPALREALQQGRDELLHGFGDDEVAALCGLLRRLNGNLDRMVGE